MKLFISYSHQDEPIKIRLREHLAAMEKAGLVTIWDDRAIPPGGHWEQAIRDELEAADLVLLLLSASFIASDYCYGEEMTRAVQRHALGQARVVPIVIGPCQWELLPFVDEHKIQMLPRDARAVTDPRHWPNQDLALEHVADELLQLVRGSAAPAAGPGGATGRAPEGHTRHGGASAGASRPDIPRLLPDLCNRGDQDSAFDVALRSNQRRAQRRPFVFVLYGDDAERLHGFRERLALVRIPRALGLDREQTSVECLTLDSPSLSVYRSAADALRAELGNKLLDDRGASLDDLQAYLGAHQPPVLLVSHFLGREGIDKLRKVAQGVLDFWGAWPDLPAGRHLLHCLSIRFEPGSGADNGADDTRKLLRRLTDREGGFKDHPNVAGAVLPELSSLQRHHVEEWAESREVQKFARIQPEDVAALFLQHPRRKPDGSIPMEPLHKDMTELAQRCRS